MAKKLKTGSYEIGRLIDQSGGMNNAVYPALLNDNEAKLLKNATLDEKGTVKTCKGRRERFAEAFSTDPVNGLTAFYPDTATSRLVIGSGTKLYKDTPHLVNIYDTQEDWETGTKSAECDTTATPGDLEIASGSAEDKVYEVTSQEDWEEGETENLDITDDIKLSAQNSFSETDTLTADFDGTHSDTEAVDDAVKLNKTEDASGSGIEDIENLINYNYSQPAEFGWKFTVGVSNIIVNKLRYYSRGNDQNYTLKLWRDSDQTLLAQTAITTVIDTWVEGNITPQTLIAGQTYTVSYNYSTPNNPIYEGNSSDATFNSNIQFVRGTFNLTPGQYPNGTLTSDFRILGLVDIVIAAIYETSGTYTHVIQDISSVGTVLNSSITFNTTTPANTTATIELRLSTDGGETWGEWAEKESDDNIVSPGTDVSNYRMQWRVNLATTDISVTPSLDDITVSLNSIYHETGTWTGEVFDVTDIVTDTSTISWTEDTPEGTTVTVETRGSDDNSHWGDWTAQTSGQAISTLNIYNQVRITLTPNEGGTLTPTVSDITMTVTQDGKRAIWTSPIIDASNAIDINASQAIIEYTGHAEIQSRSSDDEGETWSLWVNADAEGNLNHIPNDHVQVRIIYITGATVQSLQISFDNAPEATELATGFTAGSQFYFTTLLSKLIITNKLNAPRKWDGTDAVATLGGSPPHGQYTATHKNYVFMAHTAENPSRIYWSDLLDLETWGALSYIDISPNDGDWITGLLPFSDYLIITKQRSVWVLVGDGPSSFEVRRIHDGVGCIAPRSLVKMEGVFSFVGTEGIYLSDLNMPIVITERLKKTWDELNKRRLTQAASTYYDHKLRIDLPSSTSTRNDIRIIYDNIRKALYLQEFKKHASCYATFIEAGQEILLYGHSTEGQVSRADFGTTDAGEPITMDWETKWFNFGSSAVEKKVRRLYLVCVPANSDTELKVYLVVDGVEDGEPLTVVIPGTPYDDEITVRLNPKDIDVRKIRTLGYRITQSATNGGVQFHELLQEFRAKKVKAT
jgi:hypothetical protein